MSPTSKSAQSTSFIRHYPWLSIAAGGCVAIVLGGFALSGCAVVDHPSVLAKVAPPSVTTWDAVIAQPAVIEHEEVVSARWTVPLSGMLNLSHPKAIAAGFEDQDVAIVLPVHVIKHPKHGVFVIDTGVPNKIEARGIISAYVSDIQREVSIEEIVATAEKESGLKLGGVFLTHFHLDHVAGLTGISKDVPVFVGPGETTEEGLMNALTRRTFQAAVEGRGPLQEWNFAKGQKMGPIASAIDVFGDGSFWALHCPGHTPGSTAYLAVTTSGVKLFTGDTSHTWWGWENGVEPGEFTADHPANAKSLAALKRLHAMVPELEVFVGHQRRSETIFPPLEK